jgi:outer membrane protein assembly factor BamB
MRACAAVLALAAALTACTSNRPGAAPLGHGGSSTTAVASTTTGTSSLAAAQTSWLTYGGNPARTSADLSDPALTHAPVAAWTSGALDGAVYGEPLVYRNQVFVATENDTVYALSATTGATLWSLHLGTPVSPGVLPCGDIGPTVGITSTMVIDPATGTLFASGAVRSSGAVAHVVFAVDVARHRVAWQRAVDQRGWNAAAELQRVALALSAGRLLVGFGGNYGDCGAYNGWVVGVPESGTGALATYEVPSAREGAIWAPGGVTVDASGDVIVVTGNGSATGGQAFDHGNAVIELSPALVERQYFAPTDWAADSQRDADLGSTSAILLGADRLFIVGKEQTAYLLSAGRLGGIGGELASLPVCNSRGANAYVAPSVYVVCADTGTIAQVVVGSNDTLTRGWTWTSPTGTAGSPTYAAGVLWSVDTGASVLYGINPATGTTLYRRPLDTGAPPHFAAPSAAGGLILVAGSTRVQAFR